MICGLCHGFGNLHCHQNGSRQWFTCCSCGGAGVLVLSSPPEIKISKAQQKFMKPEATK